MRSREYSGSIVLAALAGASLLGGAENVVEEVHLDAFFPEIEATLVLVEAGTGRTRVHNPERAERRYLPASTFKIPNTLIALETGVADGPDFALKRDAALAPAEAWWPKSWRLSEHTLRSALRNSVVWYYQEIARRIGEDRMRDHVGRFAYGNADLSGGIDQFWLRGGLRISAREQVEFLRRFYTNRLGLSERTTRIAKEILVLETTPACRLSGKTGTADVTPTRELGWIVGYVEVGDNVHFFALNMEGERVWEDWPPQKRAELVRALLQELAVLPAAGHATP